MILLNPGSAGLAYDLLDDGTALVPPRAEYTLVRSDGARLAINLRRVPHDRDATVLAMFEREMPHADWWSGTWQ